MKGNKKIDSSHMHQLIDTVQTSGVRVLLPFYLALMAEACKKAENQEEGLEALNKAKYRMEKTNERYWEAEIYRLKGEILLSQYAGNEKEAEFCFQEALNISRQQQAKEDD